MSFRIGIDNNFFDTYINSDNKDRELIRRVFIESKLIVRVNLFLIIVALYQFDVVKHGLQMLNIL